MPNANLEPESADRTRAYLRISLTPGLGTRGAWRLLDAIGAPQNVDDLCQDDLIRIGLEKDVARTLQADSIRRRADEEWHRATKEELRIIDVGHCDYPQLLRETSDPPLVLYIRGLFPTAAQPQIAIVGSRKPSPYGVNCADRISRDLAGHGVIVVSGLARGIDAAAHRGALAEGTTIAVLGTGVDRIYPAEHRSLAHSIIEGGALVSEFPLGTLPLPQNFPRRNRILAGLALATVVVEAAERSGSLITARLALEANREVFAVPGPMHSLKSRGCHQLIQQGACLVTGWQDIARELSPRVEVVAPEIPPAAHDGTLTRGQLQLLNALSLSEDISLDALLSKTSTPTAELYSAILDLELRGLIRKLPGDRYIRNEAHRPS